MPTPSDPIAPFTGFPDVTFSFLRGLARKNDKAWFEKHRDDYEAGYVAPARSFVAALGPRLRRVSKTVSFEPKVNGSLFRIHRDVRFSKDKTPYKTHLDLWLWEGDKRGWEAPGWFFRMYPDVLMIGSGMHGLQKASLDRYRAAVLDAKAGPALVRAIAEVTRRGDLTIGGATRAKVPRGFDADHPRASLLLHEALWAGYEGPLPDEATRATFVDWCVDRFERAAPITRWLLAHVAHRGAPRGR